ncbi:response regulator [Sphingomonas sp. CJ20]
MNDFSWAPRRAPRTDSADVAAVLGGRRVLIADRDAASIEVIARPLELQGMQVARCTDVPRLHGRLDQAFWDILIIDLRVGGADGLGLLRDIGQRADPPAIVVIGAAMTEIDRIVALELGADYCLDRNCSGDEMLAVVRALLARRAPMAGESADVQARGRTACFASLRFEPLGRMLHDVDTPPRKLRTAEADLLILFLHNPRRAFPREELVGDAEASDQARNERGADVLVSRLRAALGPEHRNLIRTIRGRGYSLACDVRWC